MKSTPRVNVGRRRFQQISCLVVLLCLIAGCSGAPPAGTAVTITLTGSTTSGEPKEVVIYRWDLDPITGMHKWVLHNYSSVLAVDEGGNPTTWSMTSSAVFMTGFSYYAKITDLTEDEIEDLGGVDHIPSDNVLFSSDPDVCHDGGTLDLGVF